MKKGYLKSAMRLEDELTNWHVGELTIKYQERCRKEISITNSGQVAALVRQSIDVDQIQIQEHFYAIYLNQCKNVLGFKTICAGGLSSCPVNIQLILAIGLILNASDVILCHNHPSGNIMPSDADLGLTWNLKAAARLVGISLIDHIIITKNFHYSMCDNGNIKF